MKMISSHVKVADILDKKFVTEVVFLKVSLFCACIDGLRWLNFQIFGYFFTRLIDLKLFFYSTD